MKRILATTLAGLVLAGNAMAADGLRIESEAQFMRDYGDRIEQVGPGVYLIVAGELAGKTVSMGEAGLDYDIGVQRAQLAGSSRSKAQTRALIRQMERIRARFKELHKHEAADAGVKKAVSGSFPCYYYGSDGRTIRYSGTAQVNATTEFYLDNGGGGLNFYYARASATASGYVFRPGGVPVSVTLVANVLARNLYTGQLVQKNYPGTSSASATTGYVYSGPAFSHNISANASINGAGDCYGYVSVSDAMQP